MASYAAGVEGSPPLSRPPGTNSEAVAAADLERAAVALERAEKAISDLDAEIRTARALLTYATGGVGGVD